MSNEYKQLLNEEKNQENMIKKIEDLKYPKLLTMKFDIKS